MRNPYLPRGPIGPVLYDAVALFEIHEAPQHEVGRAGVDEQRRRRLQRHGLVLYHQSNISKARTEPQNVDRRTRTKIQALYLKNHQKYL